jgi:hypothetical protein
MTMELGPLRALRRRRRRLSSACFLVAGVGFGTVFYFLRARFQLVLDRSLAAAALLALTVGAFWLGARAEAEVADIDEKIRELTQRGPH